MSITNETRREAYEGSREIASGWRGSVLRCLKIFGPMSAFEVAAKCGKDVYEIRPRLTELRKDGIIAAVGRRMGPKGRGEAVWSAEPRAPRADGDQLLLAVCE
jgi:predicted ArsR family transcriptional regulator